MNVLCRRIYRHKHDILLVLTGAIFGVLAGAWLDGYKVAREAREKHTDIVWISTGGSSECWHDNEHCMGLSHALRVYPVTSAYAVVYLKRRPCRLCADVKSY